MGILKAVKKNAPSVKTIVRVFSLGLVVDIISMVEWLLMGLLCGEKGNHFFLCGNDGWFFGKSSGVYVFGKGLESGEAGGSDGECNDWL